MPVLANKTHERIAELMADGMGMEPACRQAGIQRFTAEFRPRIQARAAEIREERNATATAQQTLAISGAFKTREELWDDIKDFISRAKGEGRFAEELRAMELLGKDIGMFVQRIQSSQDVTILNLQNDKEARDELNAILGAPVAASDDADGGGGVVQGEAPGGEATRH